MIMKVTTVLTFICLQVSALGAAQTVTLAVNNAPLKKIFIQINQQTGYEFIYNSQMIERSNPVTLNVNDVPLDEVLEKCFENQPLSYNITDKTIIVVSKTTINEKKTEKKDEFAQQQRISISGTISDIRGNPLPMATIREVNTTNGVISDKDGNFTMMVNSANSELSISYIGFIPQRILVGNTQIFKINLEEDKLQLNETVVIGYGRQTLKDMTGSISNLDVKALESNTFTNIAQALQGQLSGVYVLTGDSSPGSPSQINIRGISSLLGNASPLIIIDEVSMPADFNLYDLDVNTIENVSVLKGASSAAIYGSRAASGVILITLKKGIKDKTPSINYNYNISVSQLNTDVNVLSAEEWKYMMLEGAYNGAKFDGFTTPESSTAYNNMTLPGYFGKHDTNWFELMLRQAVSQNHNVSLRGGGNNTNYSASVGYTKDIGVMKETDFNRFSYNFSLESKINKFITWGTSLRGNISKRNVATASLYEAAIRGRPDIAAFNPDGSVAVDIYILSDGRPNLRENPLSLLFDNDDIQNVNSLSITNFLNVDILPGLTFKSQYTINNSNTAQRQYFASTTTSGSGFAFAYKGRLYDSKTVTGHNEFLNFFTYKYSSNKHLLDAVLGTSFLYEKRDYSRLWLENFPDDYIQTQPWQGATFRTITGYNNRASMISYISRINYKYNNKYLLTVSLRRDGSTKFSNKNAYGYFPSVAIGWNVSDESFFDNIGWVNFLKLRSSLGKTGMADVGFYKWHTLFETTQYQGTPAVIPSQVGNENLRWETTSQFDIGLDYSILKSRIRGTFNYYNKYTNGLLYPFTLAPSSGFSNSTVNFAELSNVGLDIDIQADIIAKKDLNWTVMLNFNNNKNTIKKLDKTYITSLNGTQNYNNTIIREGYSLGLIYGFKTDGIFRNQEEVNAAEGLNPSKPYQGTSTIKAYVGEIRYADLNGDGWVDIDTDIDNPDRTVIGKSLPDFSGGFSTNLQYKDWTLNIYGSYSYGNDKVWIQEQWMFQTNASTPGNVWKTALKRWTPENPDSRYPSFRIGRTFPARWFNDFSVYDASFIKIQNIQLEYNLPKRVLDKLKYLSMMRVFASISNVHTFTKYPGPNPESFSSERIIGASTDNSTYPLSRNYTFGLKLTIK
jgi:TonB-dependent starch-binding outer membrane protein SusC